MRAVTRPSIQGQSWARLGAGVAVAISVLTVGPSPLTQQNGGIKRHWVGTWATAVVERAARPQTPAPVPTTPGQPAQPPRPLLKFNDQTLRQIVHTSLGGESLRVVVSNTFGGTAPLTVCGAQVALRDKGPTIVARSGRPLTFGDTPTTTIPSGALMVSDPVTLSVRTLTDLSIDIYLYGDTAASTSPLTMHGGVQQTNYVSPA